MSRYKMCPNCGHRMRRYLDKWGDWDGETYTCDWCSSDDDDDYGDDDGESISAYEAALIWASNGCDEDYAFGFSEDELKDFL